MSGIPSYPHSWFLEIIAETGAIGFLPVLALAIGLIVRDVRRIAIGGGARAAARLAMTVTFWTIASFNFSIWAPWWGVSFLFLLMIASSRPESRAAPPKMLVVVGEAADFVVITSYSIHYTKLYEAVSGPSGSSCGGGSCR